MYLNFRTCQGQGVSIRHVDLHNAVFRKLEDVTTFYGRGLANRLSPVIYNNNATGTSGTAASGTGGN